MRRILLLVSAIIAVMSVIAETPEQIRDLINRGNYRQAAEAAEEASEVDAANEGALNALLGEAMYLEGNAGDAAAPLQKAAAKGVADAYRWLGRIAYDNYDFEQAAANYARYFQLKQKAGKPTAPEAAEERDRVPLASRYMERVEQIQVIDSLTVPREGFFRHFRLPAASGRLLGPEAIPVQADDDDNPTVIFANERGDLRMWARLDSLGTSRIAQSVKLSDGSWHLPEFTDSTLNIGDADYPFMTSDGLTLYFAAKGPESIGGYDIFMATRDPADDSYRIPQNIGMPYNSPADDYMYALDEINNVGWWATDRNHLGDDITIYVFIPNEIRENYPEDTGNLANLALLSDIRDTWPEDADYSDLLAAIREIDPDAGETQADFHFVFPDGKVYTVWDNFKSERARELMETYIETMANMQDTADRLSQLRRSYHNTPLEDTADEIRGLEKVMDAYYIAARRQRSQIVRAELQ